jgi:hypothetical protein
VNGQFLADCRECRFQLLNARGVIEIEQSRYLLFMNTHAAGEFGLPDGGRLLAM